MVAISYIVVFAMSMACVSADDDVSVFIQRTVLQHLYPDVNPVNTTQASWDELRAVTSQTKVDHALMQIESKHSLSLATQAGFIECDITECTRISHDITHAATVEGRNEVFLRNKKAPESHPGLYLCLWLQPNVYEEDGEAHPPVCMATQAAEVNGHNSFKFKDDLRSRIVVPDSKEKEVSERQSSFYSGMKRTMTSLITNARAKYRALECAMDHIKQGAMRLTTALKNVPFIKWRAILGPTACVVITFAAPHAALAVTLLALMNGAVNALIQALDPDVNTFCERGAILFRAMVFEGTTVLTGIPVGAEESAHGAQLFGELANSIVGTSAASLDAVDNIMDVMHERYGHLKQRVMEVLRCSDIRDSAPDSKVTSDL